MIKYIKKKKKQATTRVTTFCSHFKIKKKYFLILLNEIREREREYLNHPRKDNSDRNSDLIVPNHTKESRRTDLMLNHPLVGFEKDDRRL